MKKTIPPIIFLSLFFSFSHSLSVCACTHMNMCVITLNSLKEKNYLENIHHLIKQKNYQGCLSIENDYVDILFSPIILISQKLFLKLFSLWLLLWRNFWCTIICSILVAGDKPSNKVNNQKQSEGNFSLCNIITTGH